MKIGIISDIHDHIWNLHAALEGMQEDGIEELICLGDLCSPFIARELGEKFTGNIHLVFGNNDGDQFRITKLFAKYGDRVQLYGEFVSLELGGLLIACHHFDNIAREIAESGNYHVVCFGHNHQHEISEVEVEGENVYLINPGTLMGVKFENGEAVRVSPTYAILDTEKMGIDLVELE